MTSLPNKCCSGCHRGRGRPGITWERDPEREMWTADFRFSWRKMETAAQDRAEWR